MLCITLSCWQLPQRLSRKESTCDAGASGDTDATPGWGRSLGGGHGNSLQYSCLENPMDQVEPGQATVGGLTKSWTRLKQLGTQACSYLKILKL